MKYTALAGEHLQREAKSEGASKIQTSDTPKQVARQLDLFDPCDETAEASRLSVQCACAETSGYKTYIEDSS